LKCLIFRHHCDGTPAEGDQTNHLMVKLLNGEEQMEVKELMTIIRAVYVDSYFPRADDFKDTESHDKASKIVRNHLNTIENALAGAKNNQVFLR